MNNNPSVPGSGTLVGCAGSSYTIGISGGHVEPLRHSGKGKKSGRVLMRHPSPRQKSCGIFGGHPVPRQGYISGSIDHGVSIGGKTVGRGRELIGPRRGVAVTGISMSRGLIGNRLC